MSTSQIIAFAVLILIVGGLAFSFFRQAPKLKRDDNPDNWSQYGGASGGDGAGPSA